MVADEHVQQGGVVVVRKLEEHVSGRMCHRSPEDETDKSERLIPEIPEIPGMGPAHTTLCVVSYTTSKVGRII